MASSTQVIVIGLDGIGFSEIGEWIDDGTLSTLRSLRGEGTASDLKSTTPPWTPCAWPSLVTGRDPGEHGVFDFFTRSGYEKSLVDRSDVRAPYLWEVADELGFTTISINFPVTHPVSELKDGAIVPGYLAPEDARFHPPDLRADFEDKYGEYRIYPEYNATSNAVENYCDVARCRRDMARLLDDRLNWDLLAVQFQVTDSVFHDLNDDEQRREVLQMVDSYVGDIVSLGGEDPTVFVVSDHGMGDYQWNFYVNSWLADNGYCQTTTGEAEYLIAKKKELVGRNDERENEPNTLNELLACGVDVLSTAGVTPRKIHRVLTAIGVAGIIEQMIPEKSLLAAQNRTVDWERSEAFQLLFNSLGIIINVKGREPAGRISGKRYEEFRDDLIDDLRAITDPDGQNVFDAVKPREDVYQGSNVALAPDIVLVPRKYEYDISGTMLGPFRRNEHKNHKPEGIFITNRAITDGTESETASIYDVAPTVAASLGIPADTAADGAVLPVITENHDRETWIEIATSYRSMSPDRSTGDVEQRLADLGYME